MVQEEKLLIDKDVFEIGKENPAEFLKLNNRLKKMGFDKVYVDRYVLDIPVFSKKLILLIRPIDYNYHSFPDTIIANIGKICKFNNSLYGNSEAYNLVDRIPVKIENSTIGFYEKKSNLVTLYYPIHRCKFEFIGGAYYLLDVLQSHMDAFKVEKIQINITDRLIESYRRIVNTEIERLKGDIVYRHNKLAEYSDYFSAYTKDINLFEIELEGLANYSQKIDSNLKAEIAELKKLKFIKKVEITGTGIQFVIPKVKIKDIDLGDFTFLVVPGRITITGNKPVIPSSGMLYYHPHVKSERTCFGTHQEKLDELLNKMKLKELAILLNMFIHNYNPNDCYMTLEHWKPKDSKESVANSEGQILMVGTPTSVPVNPEIASAAVFRAPEFRAPDTWEEEAYIPRNGIRRSED